ncbi:MAG: hypothetical protein LBD27_07225 [Tannerella sp.]|jgi:predicted anti-sigma-YlaC factor YlaD|nr:hypothetical protein [Tannerella sp.]
MNTNQNEQEDMLKKIFARMPEEPLPEEFLPEMTQRIQNEAERARKRETWQQAIILASALLAMLGLTVATWLYMDIPCISFEFPHITIPPAYISIGMLALILLIADSLFRLNYFKKRPENI